MSQVPGLPPGYPREYELVVRLTDGRQVLVRPIVPGDAPELAEAIRTADAETVRSRFLGGGPPPLTPRHLTYLTAVDYVSRFALVATDQASGRGIAVARYERTGEDVAEVAVVVSPAWRGVRLATALLVVLAGAAAERGIGTFTGTFFAANRAVGALLRDAGGTARCTSNGIAEFGVAVDSLAAALGEVHPALLRPTRP